MYEIKNCNFDFNNHVSFMFKNQISDKQLEANRMNALKSTGPKTLDGKEKSSQNAMKFGFTAKKFTIPSEEKQEFEEYHQKMINILKPNTILTEEMVLNICLAFWKSRRYANLESLVFKIGQLNEIAKLTGPLAKEEDLKKAEKLKIKNEPIFEDIEMMPPPYSFNIKSLGKISSMQNQECNRAVRLLRQYISVRSLEDNEVLKNEESNYSLNNQS